MGQDEIVEEVASDDDERCREAPRPAASRDEAKDLTPIPSASGRRSVGRHELMLFFEEIAAHRFAIAFDENQPQESFEQHHADPFAGNRTPAHSLAVAVRASCSARTPFGWMA